MPTTHPRIKVTLTAEERDQVKAQADKLGLKVSEFLRNLALGYRLPDPGVLVAADQILGLLKINADQARLGNLLKLALDEADGAFPPALIARIEDLIRDIRQLQETIKDSVETLHYAVHPRKRK